MFMSKRNYLKVAAILAVISFIHLHQLHEWLKSPLPRLYVECGNLSQMISASFDVYDEVKMDADCSKKQKCRQLFHFNWNSSTVEVIGPRSYLNRISCTYRSFGFDPLRTELVYGQWHEWDTTENLTIDEDFVNVQCGVYGTVCNTVYFGVNSTKMESRKDLSEDDFNVAMVVLDGMSQFIFRSLLKETNSLVNSWPNAIEFAYHHRVGVNSFPNMGAFLTGLTYEYPEEKFMELLRNATPSAPLSDFIWKRFSDVGYATYFMVEDKPRWYLNSPFTKLFNQHSFDYNWWPYCAFSPYQNWPNEYRCISDTPKIQVQLDHLYHYTKRFSDKRFFFYGHLSDLTHDNMYRDGNLLDQPLADLLTKWQLDGFLDKTVLFLMGDHGCRFSLPKKLDQTAKLVQENMPLLRVIIPDNFKRKYPKLVDKMRENSQKITSQYDLHATLVHLLHLVDNRSYNHTELGKSLFGDLGIRKTCADAHIPDMFCSCHL